MTDSTLEYIPARLAGLCWLSHAARPRYGRLRQAHSHAEIEANVIETGTCRYLVDGCVQSLRSGDLLWLLPQQRHMIVEASPDLSLWVMLARPQFLERQMWRLPLSGSGTREFERPRRLCERERAQLTGIATALTACVDDPAHFAHGLAWWFGEASRITATQSDCRGGPTHPAVISSLALLEIDSSLPLPELARRVNMSASRLSHLFSEQVGLTISAHRNELRLRRFERRLRAGGCRNLTAAAFEAGFGSYAQFARVLRASTGQTPRELLDGTSDA